MYNIYIRDASFRRIGEITDYTKIDLIPRFNAVGTFAIDLPTDCAASRELIKPKYGIIVKKDGQTIFSGTVTSRQRSFSITGDTMTFSGKDDNQFLTSRLAYPDPMTGISSFKPYDVRSGFADTVIKSYVWYNLGPNALPERQLPSLQIEDMTGIGNFVHAKARFDNLLELISSLAISGGVGFRIIQVNDHLEFQVYQPVDKTKTAFFSPLLGNLISFEYESTTPEANFVIVGGGGVGADRIIQQKGNNTSIAKYGRFESFVDQRDTTDTDELAQSLDEELTNKAEQNSFNFTPIDTSQLAFGRDYGLGDTVSIVLTQPNERIDIETLYYFISAYQTVPVENEKIRKIQEKLSVIQDIVREVKISITPEGESISPTVGTSDSNNNAILGIFDKVKKITKRLNKLERV
jgi:hypothetical protein